jgi:3-deoxy-D-manno-octulosonate 8-phosphate phosphatase (KDO 8-P phosphatase)
MTALDPDLASLVRTIRFVVFDFDGVLTDNFVYVDQHGNESVRCWRSDGLGLQALQQAGIGAAIISTETNPVVQVRARKLKLECVQGTDRKIDELDKLRVRHGLERAQLAFVGNDVNDRECLGAVGLPIVVQDAHEDVLALAKYRTRLPGGRGAVREVCDLFVRTLAAAVDT